MTLTGDLRCVACNGNIINGQAKATLKCTACRAEYPLVWGVPFIGSYEAEDILGLIGIAANTSNRGNFGVTPDVVEDWERLLAAYHEAPDKDSFKKTTPEAQSPFLPNRYGEWVEVNHLAQGIHLEGKDVLDVGAGLGFDSHRLAMRGAKVTALEFSPLLAEAGHKNFPHIRWIGGFSHALPFKSNSFDAVFCNAALHHMRDLPAAISEALRILRPGGYLITTCDSFRPTKSADDTELDIFDTQPAVLLGLNEGVPRFSEFVGALRLHSTLVNVDLFTHTLYNAPRTGGTLSKLTRWNLKQDGEMLAARSGSLAMRIQLKAPWPEEARLQTKTVLQPAQLADWLTSESSAVARLASLIPEHHLDLPFPGNRKSKFELLNGRRLQRPFAFERTAYRRGRWFLTRPANADALTLELGLLEPPGEIEILIDGMQVAKYSFATSDFSHIVVDLANIEVEQVFTVELRKLGGNDTLNGAALVVKSRQFVIATATDTSTFAKQFPQERVPTVFAIIPIFNRLHFTLACIRHLKTQNYPSLRIVVSDGGSTGGTVEAVRAAFPDVDVLTTTTELWWAGAMAAGINFVIQESQDNADCVLMLNNDTEIPADYVLKLVAASKRFDAAVGALIVDSRDSTRVLDAGEYVVWSPYAFPVKTAVDPSERFRDDVDVLPGRGSLIPLRMIQHAGNVDAHRFPHYLADYEFFYRIKAAGFRLGVCYETRILAHIEETGIIPGVGVASFTRVWQELFSRRSMSNVIDHWRFVHLHAPKSHRNFIKLRLIGRAIFNLGIRTPLRPVTLPILWCLLFPRKLLRLALGQVRTFRSFAISVRMKGMDAFCHPRKMPGSIRPFLYLLVSPGPVHINDCRSAGANAEELVAAGVMRKLWVGDWYAFSTFNLQEDPARRLFAHARSPLHKLLRTFEILWKSRSGGNPK